MWNKGKKYSASKILVVGSNRKKKYKKHNKIRAGVELGSGT